ncbi:MAG: sodium-coupled permease [Planctomycetota bacterium]
MTPIAWLVFGAFLAWVVADGVRRTFGAQSLEDYYAGGRKIPWWAAGLSVMATQASAITVIGTTGQGHDGGMEFVQAYLGLPFAMVAVSVILIPLYRRLPILTAYQYLEGRFDKPTRLTASFLFLVSRCLALGIVIQAPSYVLATVLEQDVVTMIIIVGLLTTAYTTLGGVSAVVWTDVKQMIAIVGGLLFCLGWLCWEVFGQVGFGGALRAAGAASKLGVLEATPAHTDLLPNIAGTQAPPSFWNERYNLFSGLIGGFFLHFAYFGADQSQVQRVLTSATANESRKALMISAVAKVPMQLMVLGIGVLLFLFHSISPDRAPAVFNPQAMGSLERQAESESGLREVLELHDRIEQERARELRNLAAHDGPAIDAPALSAYREAVRDVDSLRKILLAGADPEGSKAVFDWTGVLKAFETGDERRIAEFASQGGGDRNYVFPSFVLSQLPGWLVGLILAAIFAAAMSSVDSVLNSLSAATVVDFFPVVFRRERTERQKLKIGRTCTFLWGILGTATGIFALSDSSIIEQINKIGSFFYGSLLGIFLLGAFAPWARGICGVFGIVGGLACVFATYLFLDVAYLWFNVIGAVGVFLFAWLAARCGVGRKIA